MNHNPEKYSAKIYPYLLIGISIVISIVVLIIFSWLLLVGLIVGMIIYLIVVIKSKFFNKKIKPIAIDKERERVGNIYDHDINENENSKDLK